MSETRNWIYKVLEESNIKIKPKIVEKDEWAACEGVIYVPKEVDQQDLWHTFALKHEAKHVINKDTLKCKVTTIGTALIVNHIYCKKPIFALPAMCIGYMMNMVYWKHFESEADRFAYEHATSRQEIEAATNHFISQKQFNIQEVLSLHEDVKIIEENLKCHLSYYNRMKQHIMLNTIKIMHIQPDITVDILRFFKDRMHPKQQKRIAMGKYYLDKWDENHQ